MKYLILALVLVATPALAADAPKPDPKVAELEQQIQYWKSYAQAATEQRNLAQDQVAQLSAQLQLKEKK